MQHREQLLELQKMIPPSYVGIMDGWLTSSSYPLNRGHPVAESMTLPCLVNAAQLKTGDVVQLSVDPWATAIVSQISAGLVHFFRPYGHSADFEGAGGVLCYTGLEQFNVNQDHSGFCCLLLQRKHLK